MPKSDNCQRKRYGRGLRTLLGCLLILASGVVSPFFSQAQDNQSNIQQQLRTRQNYLRSEDQTYLTLPEWYIVYSADEFASLVQNAPPSAFPYFRSIGQFWSIYQTVLRHTWDSPSFNWGYHVMIGVIGSSFTVEYLAKGLYENSLGKLTELFLPQDAAQPGTAEDRFMQAFAQEYAGFIHATPWYAFPFSEKLGEFWALTGATEDSAIRAWERRFSFSLELLFKTSWAWMIRQSTQAAYDPEDETILAWVQATEYEAATQNIQMDPHVSQREQLDATSQLLFLPRYEPFTTVVTDLARKGVQFREIAGNQRILVTLLTPKDWRDTKNRGEFLTEWEILTRPETKRVALTLTIPELHEVIPSLEVEGVVIDHLYDF